MGTGRLQEWVQGDSSKNNHIQLINLIGQFERTIIQVCVYIIIYINVYIFDCLLVCIRSKLSVGFGEKSCLDYS